MKPFFVFTISMLAFSGAIPAVEIVAPASHRFSNRKTDDVPDFQKHVVPLLGRLGCNSAKCHGSFQGQGDLRLSLFGFDFSSDHAALHAAASSEEGRRLNVDDPERSLIVLKPTKQTDHEGGQRFKIGSWEHHLLLRWIESGAGGDPNQDEAQVARSQRLQNKSRADGVTLFKQTVQPLFEDHCYECHGFNSPKGNLSIASREGILSGGDSGPAVRPGMPHESLLMTAITYSDDKLQMPPSGKLAEEEILALTKWIKLGAPWPSRFVDVPSETDHELVKLHHEPKEIIFQEPGQTQTLTIIAEWTDGTREDVTCLARFQTNDDAIVRVNSDGLTTSTGEGDTHVIAFYDNGVAAIPVLRPAATIARQQQRGVASGDQNAAHPIDHFVDAKLDKLGLSPSDICTDAEFLRRVSIDMTGTLPTPDEVLAFLDDTSPEKRKLKVNELLERPTYAAWWTNKLCDFTGCNPKSIASLLEVAREDGYVKASEWYDWIYERVERNEPYDRIVADLMLADLSGQGDNMPYFWTRESLSEPKDTAMSVAHAFLGIQLQCAECHKHPFDQWTQADFNDFAHFFDSVTKTKRRSIADEDLELRLLRSERVGIQRGEDPRKAVSEWMRTADNPWFARAFVNRVWAGYFNRGIVDPPDQFTPANPASHPQMLDWLADGFVQNGYDMKWLHRQIAISDTYQRSWKPNETNRNDRRNFSRSIPRRIPAEVVYDAMKQVTAATDKQSAVRTNLRRRASGHLSMRMAGTHAMKVFGKPDRSINCDCERVNEPTLLQAIFTQNDPLIRMRIADSGWVVEIEDAETTGHPVDQRTLIDTAWLRTVGRLPTDQERTRANKHFEESPSTAETVSDLLWALMNTKEFLLNH